MTASEQLRLDAQELDDRAHALMQAAATLMPQGEWEEAADNLEQAAQLHARAGRSYDEARCLQLAATLRRSGGNAEKARPLAERAAAVAPADLTLEVSISAEMAETAFAEGRYQDAASAWTEAIDKAQKAGLKADGMSAMWRRRAAACMACGQIRQASDNFDEAYQLLVTTRGNETAAFVRVEQAELLREHGQVDESERVISSVEASLKDLQANPHLLAELQVLRARLALAAGKPDQAIDYSRRARDAALQAVAPVSYFAASAALAEAYEAQGDYQAAYGTLAMAWATLSDLLGDDVASSWIEPCLLGYKLRWGDSVFQETKIAYETRRRTTLSEPA